MVQAQSMVVARIHGAGTDRTVNFEDEGGGPDGHFHVMLKDSMTWLCTMERNDLTVSALGAVPTPAECYTAAVDHLENSAPGAFSLLAGSVLPDYTLEGVRAHYWIEGRWVPAEDGDDDGFGAAFKIERNEEDYHQTIRLVPMTTDILRVDFLVVVQTPQ